MAPKLPPGSRWSPSAHLSDGFIPWDVVALLAATRPQLFGAWEAHAVSVPPCASGEPCNGTMAVEPAPLDSSLLATARDGARVPGAHRNVVTVPHTVASESALIDASIELLCSVPAADPDAPPPRLHLGFLREMGLFTLAAAIVTVAVPLPWPVLRPAIVAVMALRAVRKVRAAAWPRREQWARLRRHDQKESRVTRQ